MRFIVLLGTIALGGAVPLGCGGDTNDVGFAHAGADGGDAKAGSSGVAGTTGGAGQGGGGGVGGAGTSGASGVGGSAGTLSCAAPSDTTKAALCLSFAPENVKPESDPRLDGKGVLVVQIFDTANPKTSDGGAEKAPLVMQIVPQQQQDASIAEISLANLQEMYFDGLPATVYVRSFFADNLEALVSGGNVTWGTFIGGYDFSNGLVESPPIQAVPLTIGAGTAYTQPLTALRRLVVDMSLATGTTPLDDGQGPAAVIALRTQQPGKNAPIYGLAQRACVNVTTTTRLTGLFIGSGVFYLAGSVDDFNLGGSFPPGSLVTLEQTSTGFQLPAASELTVATDAYSALAALPLNYVVPLGDAGTPPPYACPVADAGSD